MKSITIFVFLIALFFSNFTFGQSVETTQNITCLNFSDGNYKSFTSNSSSNAYEDGNVDIVKEVDAKYGVTKIKVNSVVYKAQWIVKNNKTLYYTPYFVHENHTAFLVCQGSRLLIFNTMADKSLGKLRKIIGKNTGKVSSVYAELEDYLSRVESKKLQHQSEFENWDALNDELLSGADIVVSSGASASSEDKKGKSKFEQLKEKAKEKADQLKTSMENDETSTKSEKVDESLSVDISESLDITMSNFKEGKYKRYKINGWDYLDEGSYQIDVEKKDGRVTQLKIDNYGTFKPAFLTYKSPNGSEKYNDYCYSFGYPSLILYKGSLVVYESGMHSTTIKLVYGKKLGKIPDLEKVIQEMVKQGREKMKKSLADAKENDTEWLADKKKEGEKFAISELKASDIKKIEIEYPAYEFEHISKKEMPGFIITMKDGTIHKSTSLDGTMTTYKELKIERYEVSKNYGILYFDFYAKNNPDIKASIEYKIDSYQYDVKNNYFGSTAHSKGEKGGNGPDVYLYAKKITNENGMDLIKLKEVVKGKETIYILNMDLTIQIASQGGMGAKGYRGSRSESVKTYSGNGGAGGDGGDGGNVYITLDPNVTGKQEERFKFGAYILTGGYGGDGGDFGVCSDCKGKGKFGANGKPGADGKKTITVAKVD